MFTPEQRAIYPFLRDGQTLFADPIALYRKLVVATGGELDSLLAAYNEGTPDTSPVSANAAVRLAGAAVAAFDLPPFDPATGQGTLQDEALGVLGEFLIWRDQKKTPPASSPTAPPSLGGVDWLGRTSTPSTASG